LFAVALAVGFAPASALAVSGTDTIVTIAGTFGGYSGDGGQATSAQLSGPFGVAVDAAGGVYVADEFNNRIRTVTPGGIIDRLGGTGVAGYSGDGGPATLAQLNLPTDVEVDASGNVFVADFANHRIRKISPTGLITTVAGTGVDGYSVDQGPATSARLSAPIGVGLDADGNLLIADNNNARVRRVDSNGVITTVVGSGLTGAAGDGGPATAAELNHPFDVTTDDAGNLYLADAFNHKIRKVDVDGVITTIAGTGVAGFSGDGGQAMLASLNEPARVAVDVAGNVYIADTNNHRIRRVSPGGVITTVAGTGVAGISGDGGQAAAAQINRPAGLAVRSDGGLLFTDSNHRIRLIQNPHPTASFETTPASGESPLAVTFDASGSSDSNGSIASYEWEFGDGRTASDRTVTHTYRTPGWFIAKLTVTDELGADASTTKIITASAPSPPAPQQGAATPPRAPLSRSRCGIRTATIVGTKGSDVLVGTPSADIIVGRGGDDLLRGRGGEDILCGGLGNDQLRGGRGADWLDGGPGHDWLYGQRGGDWLNGGSQSDRLAGGPGIDWLAGGRGRDRLDGGSGGDWLKGGAGLDRLVGAAGRDWLNGGRGRDQVSQSRRRARPRLDRGPIRGLGEHWLRRSPGIGQRWGPGNSAGEVSDSAAEAVAVLASPHSF